MNKKPIVYVETPFAGDTERNLAYLGACTLDCIERGEIPISSHGDLPRWLDDNDPKQRELGMQIGFGRASVCDKSVVYEDYGRSPGMKLGLEDARKNGRPVEFRSLSNFTNFFTIRNNINLLFSEFLKVCEFTEDQLRGKCGKTLLVDTKAAWVVIAREIFPIKKKTQREIGAFISKNHSTCSHYLKWADVKEKRDLCNKLKYKLHL